MGFHQRKEKVAWLHLASLFLCTITSPSVLSAPNSFPPVDPTTGIQENSSSSSAGTNESGSVGNVQSSSSSSTSTSSSSVMFDMLSHGESRMETQKHNKSAIFLLGNKGSGQAALAQMIAGNYQMEGSLGGESGTSSYVPEYMVNKENSMAFYNFPGFDSNRNQETEAASAYFTDKVTKHVGQIKFIFTATHSSMQQTSGTGGGNSNNQEFDLLITNAAKLMTPVETSKFANSIGLVITNVQDAGLSDQDVLNRAESFLLSYKNKLTVQLNEQGLGQEARILLQRKITIVESLLRRAISGGLNLNGVWFLRTATGGTPGNPGQPGSPNTTKKPSTTGNPSTTEQSSIPGNPGSSSITEQSSTPATPGSASTTEQSSTPGNQGSSSTTEQSSTPAHPGSSSTTEQSSTPGNQGSSSTTEQSSTHADPGSSSTTEQSSTPGNQGSSSTTEQSSTPAHPGSSSTTEQSSTPGNPGSSSTTEQPITPSNSGSPDLPDGELHARRNISDLYLNRLQFSSVTHADFTISIATQTLAVIKSTFIPQISSVMQTATSSAVNGVVTSYYNNFFQSAFVQQGSSLSSSLNSLNLDYNNIIQGGMVSISDDLTSVFTHPLDTSPHVFHLDVLTKLSEYLRISFPAPYLSSMDLSTHWVVFFQQVTNTNQTGPTITETAVLSTFNQVHAFRDRVSREICSVNCAGNGSSGGGGGLGDFPFHLR